MTQNVASLNKYYLQFYKNCKWKSLWKSHFTDTHDQQKQTQSYTHSFSIITRDKDNSQSCLSQFPVCEQNSCGSPKVLEHKGESSLYKKLIHTHQLLH